MVSMCFFALFWLILEWTRMTPSRSDCCERWLHRLCWLRGRRAMWWTKRQLRWNAVAAGSWTRSTRRCARIVTRYFMKKAFSRMRRKPHTFALFVQHMNRVVREGESLRCEECGSFFWFVGVGRRYLDCQEGWLVLFSVRVGVGVADVHIHADYEVIVFIP